MQELGSPNRVEPAETLPGFLFRCLLCALIVSPLLFSSGLADDKDKAIRRAGDVDAVARAHDMASGDLYAIVVGVAKYKHPKVQQLTVSDKDAKDFAEFLKSQTKLFRNIHVTLLRNEEATKSEVEKHLITNYAKPVKTILLFFFSADTELMIRIFRENSFFLPMTRTLIIWWPPLST